MKKIAQLGSMTVLLLAILLAVGTFLPPYVPADVPSGPLRLRSGLPFKYSDTTLTGRFARSLRDHDAILCLGTSETTTLKGGNWPDFLNGGKRRTTILAGAGRTAGVHLPWMADVSASLRGLTCIFYLNPVYWNEALGRVEPEYWLRYATPQLQQIPQAVRADLPLSDLIQPAPFLRSARRPWFQDARWHLWPEEFTEAFAPLKPWLGTPPTTPDPAIDLERGALKSFHHEDWFSPARAPENTAFRDQELLDFIAACDSWGVDLTIVLGPANLPFIRHHAPEAEPASQRLQQHLRGLLATSGVPFVDASDIGEIPGAFDDHQHLSSYGAALIAERLNARLTED
jgi:hypothetical protein